MFHLFIFLDFVEMQLIWATFPEKCAIYLFTLKYSNI